MQEKAQLLSGDRSGDFTVVTEDGRDIDIAASEIQAAAKASRVWLTFLCCTGQYFELAETRRLARRQERGRRPQPLRLHGHPWRPRRWAPRALTWMRPRRA